MTRRLLVAAVAVLAASSCSSPNPYYDPKKPHHTERGFRNTDATAIAPRPFGEFLRWQRERWSLEIPPPKADLSANVPDLGYIQKNRSDFAVTWVGHATVLVQIGGLNILTDPQFSERAFPVQWAGPKRHQPPALRLAELPRIDVVVVSHNHYDHLDLGSVKALNAQAGGPPLFVVPLGNERLLAEQGIINTKALDWWDSVEVKGVRVNLVPVQHWSRRTLTDANTCLWGGFVLEGQNKGRQRRVFFGGDTGYSSVDFQAIGREVRADRPRPDPDRRLRAALVHGPAARRSRRGREDPQGHPGTPFARHPLGHVPAHRRAARPGARRPGGRAAQARSRRRRVLYREARRHAATR